METERRDASTATIYGRVLSTDSRSPEEVHFVPVYLFTMEQSQILQTLQREANIHYDQEKVSEKERDEFTSAVRKAVGYLVLVTAATAITKTDSEGMYRFGNAPPGRRYQIWCGGNLPRPRVPLAARVTPKLESGNELEVNLRSDESWKKEYVEEATVKFADFGEAEKESVGPFATIQGKVTDSDWTDPERKRVFPQVGMSVYLFTMEQSKILQVLQKEGGRQDYQPEISYEKPYLYGIRMLDALRNLAPVARATAMTKVNAEGFYRFENVVPGRRYQVWGLFSPEEARAREDGTLWVRLTAELKPGETLELDLGATAPEGTGWNKQYVKEGAQTSTDSPTE